MDEFDKIREISEDLTHRREPTFENSVLKAPAQTNTAASDTTANTREDSLLKMAFANIQAENETPFTSPFSKDSSFNDPIPEEKHFPSMKLHLIGLSLFVGILGVVLAGFFIFNSEPEDISEVVTITAEPTIVKELPEQAGGMNIPDQDKLVYNRIRSDNVTTKVESLFPEPEKPVMPQILAIEENAPDEKFVDMKAVKPINPLDETISAKSQAAEQPVLPKVAEYVEPVLSPKPEVLNIKNESQPVEKAQPQEPLAATPKSITKPKQPEPVKPAPVETVKSATKPAEQPAQSKPAETAKPTPAATGAWKIQLFASNNKAAVEKAWQKIQSQQKSLLNGLPHEIESATIPGKGQFYRLKVGRFTTREAAGELCGKLKERKQDCVPAK